VMRLAPWRTVRGRLVLAALLVETVMLAMLVGNSQRLLRDSMGQQAVRQAAQISPVLAAALVAPLAQSDYATVQAVLDESHAIQGIEYLAVLDSSGQVVAASGWKAGQPLPAVDKVLNLDERPPRYDVSHAIALAGQPLGTLRFGLDLSPIVIARQNLLQQGVLIALGEMLLSAGLLSGLGLLVTRQLSRLTSASLRVAKGQLTLEPVPEGRDDVGRLGAAFNTMSQAIAERVDQLTRANEETARVAASLKERQHQLDAVFELSPDGFVTFDAGGHVRFASPAFFRLTQLEGSQVLGVAEAEFSSRLAAQCRAEACFAGLEAMRIGALPGAADRSSRMLIEIDGTPPRVLALGLRVAGPGEVAQVLFFRDVTHETEVDRMKSEFLSHAAHELRTPMASIYGFSELMLTRELTETKRRSALEIIHRQSRLMTDIIDELLDLSRIDDRRGIELQCRPVDAVALVREEVEAYRRPDGREPPRLQLAGTTGRVLADAAKLQQALRNILSNAYKYSPQGGEVQVSLVDGAAEQRAGQLGLRVADQGLGMSPAQLARVFERFYRADTSGNIPGTGLGMSIVKELIELQKGQVEVQSRLGEGTAVTLWLPAAQALQAVAAGQSAPA
jgi:signal transduction histidine kinase/HAMP domain-containing protein